MPTICKISLDAEEYRKELAAVVAETRAAQEKLSGGVDGGGEPEPDRASGGDLRDIGGQLEVRRRLGQLDGEILAGDADLDAFERFAGVEQQII